MKKYFIDIITIFGILLIIVLLIDISYDVGADHALNGIYKKRVLVNLPQDKIDSIKLIPNLFKVKGE